MATLKILVVCAALVICVTASNPMIAPTTTVAAPPSTRAPTPSPSPAPKPPNTLYTYTSGNCSIRLIASMSVNFTYNTTQGKNKTVPEVLDGKAKVVSNSSSCVAKKSAILTLSWMGPENDSTRRFLTFNFTGESRKGHQNWNFTKLTLDFNFTQDQFPDIYPNVPGTGERTYCMNGFFESVVEYQRSYKCATFPPYNFNATEKYSSPLYPSLNISNFHVQAFEFKKSNVFGNPRSCAADGNTSGSPIVPIAVGVALAVLVIAVIIAFVISKIVNRKKTVGYEKL